jgi:hypothetical protein
MNRWLRSADQPATFLNRFAVNRSKPQWSSKTAVSPCYASSRNSFRAKRKMLAEASTTNPTPPAGRKTRTGTDLPAKLGGLEPLKGPKIGNCRVFGNFGTAH